MNKTITLSSIGQDAENFVCNLPKTLTIPPNHEIALLNLNLDTHTGTNEHYTIPQIGYKLHNVIMGINRLHEQLEVPVLMRNGDYADFQQVSPITGNVLFYFKSNNGVATLDNPGTRYNGTSKNPSGNFSWQNNFDATITPISVNWIGSVYERVFNLSSNIYTFNEYTGTEDKDIIINITNTNPNYNRTKYLKIVSFGVINLYSTETTSTIDHTGTLDTSTKEINWSNGSVWAPTTEPTINYDYPTQTSGLLGPFSPENTPDVGTSNQMVIHIPHGGNIETWTNHRIINLLQATENYDGYIEKTFVPNNQLPRAEFYVSLDNLPIENFISNDTFQGIVPSIYTHHNRFDNERDESIEPKHLIYHYLTNKNEISIDSISVSIRDNITTDILHNSTFSFPSNLTIHIRQNEHYKNQDLQFFIMNKLAHKK